MIAVAVIAALSVALIVLVVLMLRYDSEARGHQKLINEAEGRVREAYEKGVSIGMTMMRAAAKAEREDQHNFPRPMGVIEVNKVIPFPTKTEAPGVRPEAS